jgi:hypothetical protein
LLHDSTPAVRLRLSDVPRGRRKLGEEYENRQRVASPRGGLLLRFFRVGLNDWFE